MNRNHLQKGLALLLTLSLLATPGVALEPGLDTHDAYKGDAAEALPRDAPLNDLLGLTSIEEVTRAVIVFEDGTGTEVANEDFRYLLERIWTFSMERHVQPLGIGTENFRPGAYINFYTETGGFTITEGGWLPISSFGGQNSIHYRPYAGNARGAFYSAIRFLFMDYEERYRTPYDPEQTNGLIPPFTSELPLVDEPYLFPYGDALLLPESEWAIPEVQAAAANNILLYDLANRYDSSITRNEFCVCLSKLLIETLEPGFTDHSEYAYGALTRFRESCIKDRGVEEQPVLKFFDSYGDPYSFELNYDEHFTALGIISGREGGCFDQDGLLTRQEAAKILSNAARLFESIEAPKAEFSDQALVAVWAQEAVDWVFASGVMNGVGGNCFDPLGICTREQAITSMNRLFELVRTG